MENDEITVALGGNVKWRFPSVHPEGMKFVLIAAAITSVLFLVGWTIPGWLMVMVTIWVFAFFRDPVRAVPQDERAIVAPADGLVTLIQRVPPPREMAGADGLGDQPMLRVSIFMSVFDVHINRTPIGGTVNRPMLIPATGTHGIAQLDGMKPPTSSTIAWMRPICRGSTLLITVPRYFPKSGWLLIRAPSARSKWARCARG